VDARRQPAGRLHDRLDRHRRAAVTGVQRADARDGRLVQPAERQPRETAVLARPAEKRANDRRLLLGTRGRDHQPPSPVVSRDEAAESRDITLAGAIDPGLTVVAQDAAALGRAAAELLFARLDGHEGPTQQVVVPTVLIERGSGELSPPG
jgi:hypothetical protein